MENVALKDLFCTHQVKWISFFFEGDFELIDTSGQRATQGDFAYGKPTAFMGHFGVRSLYTRLLLGVPARLMPFRPLFPCVL